MLQKPGLSSGLVGHIIWPVCRLLMWQPDAVSEFTWASTWLCSCAAVRCSSSQYPQVYVSPRIYIRLKIRLFDWAWPHVVHMTSLIWAFTTSKINNDNAMKKVLVLILGYSIAKDNNNKNKSYKKKDKIWKTCIWESKCYMYANIKYDFKITWQIKASTKKVKRDLGADMFIAAGANTLVSVSWSGKEYFYSPWTGC